MYTIKQAAAKAEITPEGIKYWIRQGKLPVRKPDGWHIEIDPVDLEPLILGRLARQGVCAEELDGLYLDSERLKSVQAECEALEEFAAGAIHRATYLADELEKITGGDYSQRHHWELYVKGGGTSEHDCETASCPWLEEE